MAQFAPGRIDLDRRAQREETRDDAELVGAASYDYLEFSGYVVVSWLWMRMTLAACRALLEDEEALEGLLATLPDLTFEVVPFEIRDAAGTLLRTLG